MADREREIANFLTDSLNFFNREEEEVSSLRCLLLMK